MAILLLITYTIFSRLNVFTLYYNIKINKQTF